jgi:DNA transformation protein
VSNSPTFVQHALDLLNACRPVTGRAMFGGHGIYAAGVMFGLIDGDELFLKTDAECRAAFVAAGCKAWVYPSPQGPMVTSYYQPPAAAMDDPEELKPWVELAVGVARRKQAAKAAKGGGRGVIGGAGKARAKKAGRKPASKARAKGATARHAAAGTRRAKTTRAGGAKGGGRTRGKARGRR